MPSADEMMKEMRDAVKDVPDDILIQVDKELEDLSKTEGLTGISNLEHMYGIWQKRKGKVGKKNVLNSWFAWASGLTKKKPDGDFMEPRRAYARDGFPDIDTDFDDQAAVYQYIIDKYGRENVGNIGTHSTLKLRDCITRLIKSLDIADCWSRGPEEFRHANMMKVDEILGTLPKGYKIVLRDKEGNPIVAKNVRMAYEYCDEFKYYLDLYPQILRHVDNIEGLKSHFGKHASGIVVSDVPLETLAPLRRTKEEGKVEYATQYSLEDLEALGLIKFDVLSIITLRVIGEAIRIIKERYDIDVDITNIPLDDTKTLALYRTGNLTGVFQCENPGMQNTMRQIGVDRFDDVVAAIALFRPGPMDSIPEYCARKTGDKRVEYFHKTIEPHVKPYLKDTYGVLVYQEQVMQLCNALAGFSIGDGYSMIKGVGKKKENIINKYRKQFIEGCIANGVPDTVAEQYWTKFITPFSSYGFNKSMLNTTLIPTPLGERKLEDFQPGDMVYSIDENGDLITTNVVNLHDHGYLEGYKVIFDDGYEVVCSANHKFLTEKGPQPLWFIWRNRVSVFGTQYQGDCHAQKSSNMESPLWQGVVDEQKTEESPDVLQNMSVVSMAKEEIWRNNCSPSSMRRSVENLTIETKASKKVRSLHENKGKEYIHSHGQVERRQQVSCQKEDILRYSQKNICSTGCAKGQNETIAKMERRKPRKIHGMYFGCTKKSQKVKNGILVKIRNRLERQKNSVWGKTKTSGFRKRFCLDRGRWLLSFFRASKSEKEKQTNEFRTCPNKGRNAKYRSYKEGGYVAQDRDGMLQEFERFYERGLVDHGSSYAQVSQTGHLVSREVVRIVPVGKKRMFDLEVACSTHNFLLPNGIATLNSHSCCYGYISWTTAYLKAHFTDEYICANINVNMTDASNKRYEKIAHALTDARRNFGIKILPKTINDCGALFKIERQADSDAGISNTEIRPGLGSCKGLGLSAAKHIAEHSPYKDLRDLATRTSSEFVNSKAVEALVEDGFYLHKKVTGNAKEKVVAAFVQLREDLKRAGGKGDPSMDIFG